MLLGNLPVSTSSSRIRQYVSSGFMKKTEVQNFMFNLVCSYSRCFHSSESEQAYTVLRNLSSTDQSAGPLHARATKIGTSQKPRVSNRLLSLYFKSGNASGAQKLFDEIMEKDVRTWTVFILGFERIGSRTKALHLFAEMQTEGIFPNKFTLSIVLKCCICTHELQIGKSIHSWVARNSIDFDVTLENSLLDLYTKCGALDYAERTFYLMHNKDTISWNIMIGGLVRNGDMERALSMFHAVPFKDVSSWNTVISGQVKSGAKLVALQFLRRMAVIGPAFNGRTFSIALNLISSLSMLRFGEQIHAQILISGMGNDGFTRNSLIDMYCKCRDLLKADMLFKARGSKICSNDVIAENVSWSSIVSGYVRSGRWGEGLEAFRNMIHAEIRVDAFTLSSIASICAHEENLDLGQQIHTCMEKEGYQRDMFLLSSLVDMYCKCGSLGDARMVFDVSYDKNIVLWTSMIYGYGMHGQGIESVYLFNSMISQGIIPNELSFLGVLTACSHAGLLDEGRCFFQLMKNVYKIKPEIEHITCMVDLFGRAGLFNEIKEFISKNIVSDSSALCSALLSACKFHKNVEMGRWVAENLVTTKLCKPEPYLLLSDIYAAENKWDEAANMRLLMKKRGDKKIIGQSWI